MSHRPLTIDVAFDVVCSVYSGVLGVPVDDLKDDDDFFALGGHSLALLAAVAQIESATGVQVPLDTFFESPTVGAVAKLVAGEGVYHGNA